MNNKPPRYLLRFFRWFCHPDYVEDIEGDLLERFEKKPSRWRFALEILMLIRPNLINNSKRIKQLNYHGMIIYFFKIGFRNAKRPGVFSVINFLSFSMALAASLLIYEYVDEEYKTDSFFTKKDDVYRLVRKVEDANASYRSPLLAAPYKEDFVNSLGIEEKNIARLFKDDELITFNDKSFFEENFYYSDASFLELLDFPLQYGDPRTVLDKPNSVVISQGVCKKVFWNFKSFG